MRRALRRRDMLHAPHDRLAKRILEQLLDEWGRAIIEFPVSASDDQRFDLWFPGPAGEPPARCVVRVVRAASLITWRMKPLVR